MKLHEEFKTYENLWEDYELDPTSKLINSYEDFVFDYEGWEEEGYEDHFDPASAYGHYQTSSTTVHPDFTYDVDAMTVFETLRDKILPEKSNKISDAGLQAEYKKLEAAWENSTEEARYEAGEALDLFIAENLEAVLILNM